VVVLVLLGLVNYQKVEAFAEAALRGPCSELYTTAVFYVYVLFARGAVFALDLEPRLLDEPI
jgi:hypothetical protein